VSGEAKARYDPQRDAYELDMLRRALDVGIPVLGICRGAQLLNVALGGTLHQDTRPIYKNSAQRTSIFPVHSISIEGDSRLSSLINAPSCRVNNLHHQAVDRCGEGLVAVAHDEHGIIEAIESAGDHFILGVQWHPEYMPYRPEQRALFSGFVEAARGYNRQLAN
jgi:putative glutamine amidotransferase